MRITRFLRNVVPPPLLTRSHYEYVKNFELPDSLLPQTFLVVRLDGKGFTKFSRDHGFRKPFDLRSIGLFNKCAEHTMQQFPEIMLAYGHSDEYSFVLPKDTDLFNRRASKIATSFASTYASSFVYYWHEFFSGGDTKQQQQQQQQQLPVDVNAGYETMSPTGAEPPPMMPHYPPAFDGRVVCYPTFPLLRDYLSWRQADCHFNNLYNTLYWTIIKRWGKTHEEACALIKGKTAAEQDAMLFSQFDVRYPRLPTLFRMGSILVRKEDKEQQQQQQQQEQHQQPQYHSSNNINNRKEKRKKDRGRSGSGSSSSSTQNKKIVLVQTELGFNSEAFWKEHAPEFITATDTTSSS